MANRFFNQFTKTLEKEVCNLYMRVTVGANGAPTIIGAQSKGIQSISRTGTGQYQVFFGVPGAGADTYFKFLFGAVTFDDTNAGFSPTSLVATMENSNNVSSGSGGNIFINIYNTSAAQVDVPNGMAFWAQFTLKNSSAF